MKLNGKYSIIGHAVIVHEKEDDFKTQPTGNAGARIGNGVIGIAK
jgi:Cu-Zn family superoxide dismutase